MKRKVIQIATLPESESVHAAILALCDDGSLWKQRITRDGLVWEEMATPPEEIR